MRRAEAAAVLFCALFIVLGVPWIERPGIQTDEALFAAGIYPPFDLRFVIHIFKHDYPLMEMTYVGALKARLWAVIFKVWPPSPASVRAWSSKSMARSPTFICIPISNMKLRPMATIFMCTFFR